MRLTRGASWGKISHSSEPREVFFNVPSMVDEAAFWTLELGQTVEFEEELDRSSGLRAVQVRVTAGSTTN